MTNDHGHIEVELRAVLDSSERERVLNILNRDGMLQCRRHRVFVDYSTFLPGEGIRDQTLDIRAQSTDRSAEIVVKTGSLGGNESWRELIVPTDASLGALVQLFGLLGFCKAIVGVRDQQLFTYSDAEVVIADVPNHSTYMEIEKVIQRDNERDNTVCEIEDIYDALGIR